MKKLFTIILSLFTIHLNAQDKGIHGEQITGHYIKVDSLIGKAVPNNFTLQFWVKAPSTTKDNEGVFNTNLTNTTVNMISLSYIVNGTGTQKGQYYNFRVYNSAGTSIVSASLFKDIRDHFRNGYENLRFLTTLTCSYNGSNYTYKCYLNDSLISTATASTKPATFQNFTFFQDRSIANRWGKSQMGDAKYYSSTLSHAQVDSAYLYGSKFSNLQMHLKFDTIYQNGANYLSPDSSGNNYNAKLISFSAPLTSVSNFTDGNQNTKTFIMLAGNSLTVGYSPFFMAISKLNWWVKSEAVSGTTTLNMINRFDKSVKPYYNSTWGKNVIVVFELGNDLYKGASLDSTKHDMMRYSDSVNSVGFTPYYVTMPARCNIVDSIRRQANAWLIATYPRVIDPCIDTLFGNTFAYNNPAIYVDACTHFTRGSTGGYNKFATIIKNGLIGGGLRVAAVNILPEITISIYPNPSEGGCSIISDGAISIYDLSGKLIYSFKENLLHLFTLPSGVYFVNAVSEKGTTVKKIIIN